MEIILILIIVLVVASSLGGMFLLGRWLYEKFIAKEHFIIDETIKEKSMIERKELKNNISVRFFIIGVIAFLMLIPLEQVGYIVDERSSLHHQVLSNIASEWGNPQVVMGPVLVLPIVEKYNTTEKVTDNKGNEKLVSKMIYRNKNVIILPKQLHKEIALHEHYRYRSIYKSLVYTTDIGVKGAFVLPDISKLSDALDEVRYDKAYLVMGLSDTKAIENVSALSFGTHSYTFEPGTMLNLKGIKGGFHTPLELNASQNNYTFDFTIKTNGSSFIRFSAFGEKTEIVVHSSWKHPSFQGAILPKERNITDEGFTAVWKIPSLARNFPQSWIYENHNYSVDGLLTGVNLYEPVALYTLIERSVKYGVLFILLTFLTFLVFEVTQKSKLHYVQYILIGLALGLFFLTLLSLSEHIAFLPAYIGASAITILSISIYTWFSNRSLLQFFSILTLLSALYTILYSLLQLEDYALLMGTGLMLLILFVLMWITRNLKASEA